MNKLGVTLRWSMACVVVVSVSGCGKTEDGGSGAEDVSEDGSKPLDDLSDTEVTDVCEEVADVYEDVTAYERGICVLESVASSGDGASCEAAVEGCIDDLEVTITSVDECSEMLDFTGCEATVGELNDCIAEQRQIVERIAALRSCEDALREGASAEEWFENAPACERLMDRCPAAFGEPDDVDDTEVPQSPGDTPHVIEGAVDGEAVEIRPNGGLMQSHGSTGEAWSSSLEFGGATLWLWGEMEMAQGLLRMPPSGSEVSSWLCLDAVELQRGTETSTWESSSLSELAVACDDDAEPLELTFAIGYPVTGVLHGEAVEWVSAGFSCGSGTCRFQFEAADTAWTGLDRWTLEIDTSIEEGASKEFGRTTLIYPSGVGTVACGGGGVVSWGEDDEFQIVVDALGPLTYCPGTPVDGELGGAF